MSWYSDGEPFDEFEPEYCKYCERDTSYEICKECKAEHNRAEIEWEEEREDDWDFYSW